MPNTDDRNSVINVTSRPTLLRVVLLRES